MKTTANLILHNGRITTLDPKHPEAKDVIIVDGRIAGVDNPGDFQSGPETKVVDLRGRRVIPGLYDSHLHVIRGGLNYNMELRWEGVPSVSLALQMLREQAARTPAPQWVRVVGGWSEFQFAERRMPTLEEINAVAPDTPVFVLHLYCRALLNRAALKACGYTKDTPNPPGGEIVRDKAGNLTGMIIARPNATILYATLAKGPKLPPEYQYNSTRHFMRELNRLGLTSVCDAGGGYQNYPEDYEIIQQLHQRGEMTLRIAYNLFTQKPGGELEDFVRWSKIVKPDQGDDMLRCNGAGEMLVFSAGDFEDFLEPRPDLPEKLEGELERVVSFLAENRWPFRLHATYEESITRFLDIFERVNQNAPLERSALVFRPLRNDFRSKYRASQSTRRRHCHSTSNGLSGRILCGSLWRKSSGAHATDPANAGDGRAGRRRHGRDTCRELQSLCFTLLDDDWKDVRRPGALSRKGATHEGRSPPPLYSGQHLDVARRRKTRRNFSWSACRSGRADRRLLHSSGRGDQIP